MGVIYLRTCLANGKQYVGQTIDFKNREHQWKLLKWRYANQSLTEDRNKYGLDNFKTEILEECDIENIFDREKYYIEKYDTYYNGYNETLGGEGVVGNEGEKHPHTKLTNEDVFYIREQYNNRKDQKEVFKEFAHLIGESGFKKIWNGSTWTKIHMDVYTPENKAYYLYKRNSHSENNSHAKLTEQDVRDIRLRKKNGEKWQDVYQDYTILKEGSFKLVWYGQNWKNVIV
jgi:group I intron endonuclease